MQLRVLIRGLILSAIALWLGGTLAGLLGCSAGAERMDAAALRRQFPAQAEEVLRGRFAFTPSAEGFEAWPRDTMESEAFEEGLRARLPGRGDGALEFELPGGFQARVREIGAGGTGSIAEDAVAYAREGGMSFWAASEVGVEEWLWIEAARVRRDAPIGVWEVEGAALRLEGEAVLVVDERGTAQMRVTAPAAYAEGGRPIATRLAAEGARVSLWVEAEAEAVLVDPGWIPLKHEMACARSAHTATRLQDGRVLVAGGVCADDGVEVSAELFDPTSKTWTSTKGPIHDARQFHTATLLPDGRVLVTGGKGHNAVALASAELFDPASNSWTPAASMKTSRNYHTATLLLDGHVLVVGGEYDEHTSLASAELFDLAIPSVNGRACTTPLDCQSGFCAYGVCCDQACLGGTCFEALGAPADGTCTADCSPYAFSQEDRTCIALCNSVSDCAPGFACNRSQKCVRPPPDVTYSDIAGCHLAAPSASDPATSSPVELGVVLLSAASMLRRRRRRRSAPLG